MHVCFTGVERDAGERAVFELLPAQEVPSGLRLARGGSVLDMASYELSLHMESSRTPVRALMSINGGAPEELVHTRTALVGDEVDRVAFVMSRVDPHHPDRRDPAFQYFKMTYGFGRVELEVFFEDEGDSLLVGTFDIPCRSQSAVDSANVEKMLGRLLDSDDAASRWMFDNANGTFGPYAVMDGSAAEHVTRSPAAMIELVDRVLDEYERQAGFFRSGAHSRIVRQGRTVPLEAVHRAGRDELMWLSRNTAVLAECREGEGIFYNGRWYLPRKVQTSVKARTFDSYENRHVLGFLDQVLNVAALLHSTLDRASSDVRTIEEELDRIAGKNAMLPALAIVRAYAARERRFLGRIAACIDRARELRLMYGSFLPDVQEAFGRTVRRTKVFTEVRPYVRLFSLMQEWLDFGDFSLAKEGLALQAAKMDKLYEYFALHRMLAWLAERGFAPKANSPAPVRRGRYTAEGFFKPETGVSTVYELECIGACGPVCLTLYYQPIIRSDMLEEEGVVLHRLSYSEGSRSQNYWTPDYLMVVTGPDGVSTYHALDAKYSMAHKVYEGYPKWGTLAECVMKYRSDVAGAAGERVDSVWLLAGKWRYADVQYAESSPWARAHANAPRSGVAALTAEDDRLDAVFAEVLRGVAGMLGDEVVDGARKDAPAADDARDDALAAADGDLALPAAGPELEEVCLTAGAVHVEGEDPGSAFGASREPAFELMPEIVSVAVPNVAHTRGDVPAPPRAPEPVPASDFAPEAEPASAAESPLASGPAVSPDLAPGATAEAAPAKRHKKKRLREKPVSQPKAPKPIKKANLPKAKPEKKRKKLGLFELDEVTRVHIESVVERVDDKDLLFNVRWAQVNLGLERPLLRKRQPEGREAGFYEQSRLTGDDCWLATRWTPVQKNKVKAFAKTLEEREGNERP